MKGKEVIYHLNDALTAINSLKDDMDISELLKLVRECKEQCEKVLEKCS